MLKAATGSEWGLNALDVDELLEHARLYLEGNMDIGRGGSTLGCRSLLTRQQRCLF